MSRVVDRNCCILYLMVTALIAVKAQGGGVTWGAGGNNVGAGAWSNSQGGGGAPGMHPPGNLGGQDGQISYGYAGIDSRGPYGGAGGNGGYYVAGTDEHGRPYSYNGGVGGQPGLPGQPGYPNNYGGYRSSANALMSSMGVALALTLISSRI